MTMAVDIVLFDLGGVLVDFGGVGPMRELSGIESDDELWRRWLTCRWVRSFERGGCSAEEFAAGVVSDWDLPIAPDEFLDGFGNWLGGPLVGSDELVGAVRSIVPVGCLSNTNSCTGISTSRSGHCSTTSTTASFRSSSACSSPTASFDRVAELLAVPANRILFLDDNELNVDGATAAGSRPAMSVA